MNPTMDDPEPWLRGPLPGVDPIVAAVLRSFQHAREDLERWTETLDDRQMWLSPHGLAPVGFQLRHIAGSVDRLTTYLRGEQLSEAQVLFLRYEMEPGATREQLLADVGQAFARAEAILRTLDPATISELRYVGKKRLPVTIAGLVVHIAEHTQRHVGQAIVTAKLADGID